MSEITCDYCGGINFSICFYHSNISFITNLFEDDNGITGIVNSGSCIVNDPKYLQVICNDCRCLNPRLNEVLKGTDFIKEIVKDKNLLDL
jgi:hypothetical protein